MKFVLAGPLVLIAALVFGALGIGWETIWVSKINALFPTWPQLSFMEWFGVNCIVSILTQNPSVKREPTATTLASALALPLLAWGMVALLLWWMR